MGRTLHIKPGARDRLRVGRTSDAISFVLHDDGSAVVVYGRQPSARCASLRELLELHGLREADVE